MLYDSKTQNVSWELNLSKAIALREICRQAPHLYAKDVVKILSVILNECSSFRDGLASAMVIQAVTELCKAYEIDAAGKLI